MPAERNRIWSFRLSLTSLGVAAIVGQAVVPVYAQAFDHQWLARQALERHIVPGYRRLVAATARQSAALASVCDHPGDRHLAAARDAFKGALVAWGRVEHIRFGPISEHNRLDAMLFWPDPRGIARRQISRLLAQRDPSALSPATLAGKSVAVQGFSALDVVLFASGSQVLARSTPAERFRCSYAHSLAVNLETMARQTLDAWTDATQFAGLWLEPGDRNPAFLTPTETTHALVQAYLNGLKQVRNVRIGGPLGLKQQGVRALEPAVPHSGMAFDLLLANIEGLRALLVEPDLAGACAEDGPRGIVQSVVVEMDLVLASMRKIAASSPDPFRTQRRELMSLGWPLRNAHGALAGAMAEAAGLSIGFNALDGD